MKTKILSIVGFTIAFIILFISISYAIRPTSYFIQTVESLDNEESEVDVLCIGGSSTYVYWIPMIAYENYGISSYNYSDSAMHPDLIKGLLEESRTQCNPKLYIIDVRGFEVLESAPEVYNQGYFNTYTGAYRYDAERFKMIHYAYPFVKFDVRELDLQLDLFCNHDSFYRNIYENIHTDYRTDVTKGSYINKREYERVTLNNYESISTRKTLNSDTERILIDLLKYIKEENLQVLFLLNAYSFTGQTEREFYNSLFDIIESYGFPYVDTNMYYEEMNLDGNTDFYNANHVNAIGAEKYTLWLSKWIKEYYDIPDRRGEKQFEKWNEQMIQFDTIWSDLKAYYVELINTEGVL